MTHTLILKLPQQVYEPLAGKAKTAGITPEQLAVECLSEFSRQAAEDPVEAFIGAVRSNVPGWPEEHDKYLGETQALDAGAAEGAGA